MYYEATISELITLNKFFDRIEESAETFDDYLTILNKCHFNHNGMSYPINAVDIDIKNKTIEFKWIEDSKMGCNMNG